MKFIFLIMLMLISVCANAQENAVKSKQIEMNGYIKDVQNMSFVKSLDSVSSLNLLHNRLNFKWTISSKFSAKVEIRNRLFYGDALKKIPDFGNSINQYNSLINLSQLWINNKTLVFHSVIDRILVQYATEKWDVKIGRQRINWGINTIWSPNDLFNSYNFLDFDYEERPGNDAIRIQHFFTDNSTLEMAYKPGKNKDETIAAMLYKFNKNKYDYQILGGIYLQDLVVGGGWAGSIKEAGFKGEMTYFHPKDDIFNKSGVISFSIMGDYTFKNDWYVAASGLFNSSPIQSSSTNLTIFGANLSAKTLFPYRYTFYFSVLKSFSPISSLNFSLIYSPEKNALILFPTYSWNVAKNFDINLIVQSFFANENKTYQSLGTSFYLRGKFSF